MLPAPFPRLAWPFGTSPDLSFTWIPLGATPETAPAFIPPVGPGLAEAGLAEPGLLAALPPSVLEVLPPAEAPAPPIPIPAGFAPGAPLPEPPATVIPPAGPAPIPPLPDLPFVVPEPPLPVITPPGPNPFAADPAALLAALQAALPPLPEGLPPVPPPPLAWFM